MDKPEIETLSYHSSLCKCPECKKNPGPKPPKSLKRGFMGLGCNKPEQPNQQIMLIKAIQGLTTAILDDISKLPESKLKDQAYDDMNIFETGILSKLQEKYE